MNDPYSGDGPAQKDEPVSTRDNQDCVNVVSRISIFLCEGIFYVSIMLASTCTCTCMFVVSNIKLSHSLSHSLSLTLFLHNYVHTLLYMYIVPSISG